MAKLIYVSNPFDLRSRQVIDLDLGLSLHLGDHIRQHVVEDFDVEDWHVSLNGKELPTSQVEKHLVSESDWLCILPRVAKGGGGKNPLKILAVLALTAVAFGAFGGAGAGAGGFFGSAAGKSLMMGAAMLLGGGLLGGMNKRPQVDMPTVDGSSWENSPEWDTGMPRTIQGAALPLTYGTVRVQGGQVLNQHITSSGDEQYLNLLLCGGEGPIDSISDLEINGQPMANFSEVPDAATSEELDYTLDPTGAAPTVYTTTGACTGFQVELTLPSGIGTLGAPQAINTMMEYRASGAGTWIPFPALNFPGHSAGICPLFGYRPSSFTHGGDTGHGVNNLASAIYEIRLTIDSYTGSSPTVKLTGINYLEYQNQPTEYTRLGTNNQSIIPYFGDTYSDQALGIELATTYQTYQTDGTAVEGLEVHLEFPQGLGYVKDDGEMHDTWVDVQAQYRAVGSGTWLDWDTWRITAAEKKAVRRSYRLDSLAADQYEVQIKIANQEGTTSRFMNDCVWSLLTSIIYDDFSYPGRVLVGIRAMATQKLNGSMPRVTWMQTRSTVNVYDVPGAAYTTKAADNPAWICYDLIHRARLLANIQAGGTTMVVHGDGHDKINYQAFSDWADFCDELVDGEKRCVCNIYMDSQGQLWDQLQKVAEIGRGSIVLKGTEWSAVWDEASDPVQLFSVGNIEIDSLSGDYLTMDERANAIEATFVNEDKDYQRDTITVYGDDYDDDDTPTTTQVFFAGLTNYERVYRAAAYRLRLNKYLKRTINFQADVDAIACQVGDVILVQHDVTRWGEGGRIVSATSGTVTLDKEVTLAAATDYQVRVRHSNDTMEVAALARVGIETTGSTWALAGTWTSVPDDYSVYSFGLVDLDAKPFRVISMERTGELKCKISALEYYAAVYSESLTVPTVTYTTAQAAISEVAASFDWDSTGNGFLNIRWTPSRDNYGGAIIVVNRQYVGRVGLGDTSFQHFITSDGTYTISVMGLSTVGVSTGFLTRTVVVDAYAIPTVTVTDITENTYILADGTVLTDVEAEFQAEYFRGYNGVAVYYSVDGGAWQRWTDTGLQDYAPSRTASGAVTIKALPDASTVAVDVRMITSWGTEGASNPSSTLNLTGKSDPPADVTGFSASQENYGIELTWADNTDVDLSEYEIRQGASWAAGSAVYRGRANYARLAFTGSGTFIYWIKALDRSGNWSATAATDAVTVTAPAIPTINTVAINGGIRATISHSQNVDWSHYIIERRLSPAGTPATVNSHLVSKTWDDTDIATLGYTSTWEYRVTAVDRNGATGTASGWTAAVAAKKIETLDITTDQLVGLDIRNTCNAGDGSTSGVKITTSGIEGYNGATKNTCLDAATGTLYAQNANIAGCITAACGTIAGWNIYTDCLAKCDATLSSTGYLNLGTGTNVVRMDAQNATHRLWAGCATASLAPFQVCKDGSIKSTAGTIGGWTLTSGQLSGGNICIQSSGHILAYTSATCVAGLWSGGFYAGCTNAAFAPFCVGTSGAIRATSGCIGGWILNPGYLCSGTTLLCCTGLMKGGSYVAGVKGWQIDSSGNAEFNSAKVRGEFRASVFSYDDIHAVGGQALIAPAGQVLTCFTSPGSAGSAFNLDVTDPESGHVQLFAVGDIVRMKTWNGSAVADVWGAIASATDCLTYYRYSVTLCSGTSSMIPANTAVVSYGSAASGGGVMLAGQGTGAPYVDIFSTGSTPWSGVDSQVRIGSLVGTPVGSGWGLWTCNAQFSGGVLQSSNWANYAGSYINLNTGVIAMGGLCGAIGGCSGFSWDGTSAVVGGSIIVCRGFACSDPHLCLVNSSPFGCPIFTSIRGWNANDTNTSWSIGTNVNCFNINSGCHDIKLVAGGPLIDICPNCALLSHTPYSFSCSYASFRTSSTHQLALIDQCSLHVAASNNVCSVVRGYDRALSQMWSLGTYGNAAYFWANVADNMYFGTANATRLCLTNTLATFCTSLNIKASTNHIYMCDTAGGLPAFLWMNNGTGNLLTYTCGANRMVVGAGVSIGNTCLDCAGNDYDLFVLDRQMIQYSTGSTSRGLYFGANATTYKIAIDSVPLAAGNGYVRNTILMSDCASLRYNTATCLWMRDAGTYNDAFAILDQGTEVQFIKLAASTTADCWNNATFTGLRQFGIAYNCVYVYNNPLSINQINPGTSISLCDVTCAGNASRGVIRMYDCAGTQQMVLGQYSGIGYFWSNGTCLLLGTSSNCRIKVTDTEVTNYVPVINYMAYARQIICSSGDCYANLWFQNPGAGRCYVMGITPSACGCLFYLSVGGTSTWALTVNKYANINIGMNATDAAGATTRLLVNISCSTGTAFCANQASTSAGDALRASTANIYGYSGFFDGGNFQVQLASTSNCFTICNLCTGPGTPLVVDAGGRLLCYSSSLKSKTNIQPITGSPWLDLRPQLYAFCGNPGICRFGLIAEYTHEVMPWLVNYGRNGEPVSIDYSGVATLALAGVNCLDAAHQVALECIGNLEQRLAAMERKLEG